MVKSIVICNTFPNQEQPEARNNNDIVEEYSGDRQFYFVVLMFDSKVQRTCFLPGPQNRTAWITVILPESLVYDPIPCMTLDGLVSADRPLELVCWVRPDIFTIYLFMYLSI